MSQVNSQDCEYNEVFMDYENNYSIENSNHFCCENEWNYVDCSKEKCSIIMDHIAHLKIAIANLNINLH